MNAPNPPRHVRLAGGIPPHMHQYVHSHDEVHLNPPAAVSMPPPPLPVQLPPPPPPPPQPPHPPAPFDYAHHAPSSSGATHRDHASRSVATPSSNDSSDFDNFFQRFMAQRARAPSRADESPTTTLDPRLAPAGVPSATGAPQHTPRRPKKVSTPLRRRVVTPRRDAPSDSVRVAVKESPSSALGDATGAQGATRHGIEGGDVTAGAARASEAPAPSSRDTVAKSNGSARRRAGPSPATGVVPQTGATRPRKRTKKNVEAEGGNDEANAVAAASTSAGTSSASTTTATAAPTTTTKAKRASTAKSRTSGASAPLGQTQAAKLGTAAADATTVGVVPGRRRAGRPKGAKDKVKRKTPVYRSSRRTYMPPHEVQASLAAIRALREANAAAVTVAAAAAAAAVPPRHSTASSSGEERVGRRRGGKSEASTDGSRDEEATRARPVEGVVGALSGAAADDQTQTPSRPSPIGAEVVAVATDGATTGASEVKLDESTALPTGPPPSGLTFQPAFSRALATLSLDRPPTHPQTYSLWTRLAPPLPPPPSPSRRAEGAVGGASTVEATRVTQRLAAWQPPTWRIYVPSGAEEREAAEMEAATTRLRRAAAAAAGRSTSSRRAVGVASQGEAVEVRSAVPGVVGGSDGGDDGGDAAVRPTCAAPPAPAPSRRQTRLPWAPGATTTTTPPPPLDYDVGAYARLCVEQHAARCGRTISAASPWSSSSLSSSNRARGVDARRRDEDAAVASTGGDADGSAWEPTTPDGSGAAEGDVAGVSGDETAASMVTTTTSAAHVVDQDGGSMSVSARGRDAPAEDDAPVPPTKDEGGIPTASAAVGAAVEEGKDGKEEEEEGAGGPEDATEKPKRRRRKKRRREVWTRVKMHPAYRRASARQELAALAERVEGEWRLEAERRQREEQEREVAREWERWLGRGLSEEGLGEHGEGGGETHTRADGSRVKISPARGEAARLMRLAAERLAARRRGGAGQSVGPKRRAPTRLDVRRLWILACRRVESREAGLTDVGCSGEKAEGHGRVATAQAAPSTSQVGLSPSPPAPPPPPPPASADRPSTSPAKPTPTGPTSPFLARNVRWTKLAALYARAAASAHATTGSGGNGGSGSTMAVSQEGEVHLAGDAGGAHAAGGA